MAKPNDELRRILIFGLSANPPTLGHRQIVDFLSAQTKEGNSEDYLFHEIWVIPVYKHMYRNKKFLEAFHHRVNMCNLCFQSIPRVTILTVEEDLNRSLDATTNSRIGTIDVLRHLHQANRGVEFYFVVGQDTYNDLCCGRWKESERVLELTKIVLIDRILSESSSGQIPAPSREIRKDFDLSFTIPSLTESISSTAVRNMDPYHEQDKLKTCVSPSVLRYMKEYRLYGYVKRHIWDVVSSFLPEEEILPDLHFICQEIILRGNP